MGVGGMGRVELRMLRLSVAGEGGEGGRRVYSLFACLSHSTIGHASLWRRNTAFPARIKDPPPPPNVWAVMTLFPCNIHEEKICWSHPLPVSAFCGGGGGRCSRSMLLDGGRERDYYYGGP